MSFRSIVLKDESSQGLATNEYGFDVNAPTGQTSITLPDNSENSDFSKKLLISIEFPLPITPKKFKPEISRIKRTQRVHCIQRVIIVFIKGPQFLSFTERLKS
jgi:hypothetical protein